MVNGAFTGKSPQKNPFCVEGRVPGCVLNTSPALTIRVIRLRQEDGLWEESDHHNHTDDT